MAQVTATAQHTFDASADKVLSALADYSTTRPRMLTEHYSDYEVREGGQGAGTVVHWKLAATSKRTRDCLVTVTTPGEGRLEERDANSTMVTTWTVTPSSTGSQVRVQTTWTGASGIPGFFERTFAPRGLQRIYTQQLTTLAALLNS